MDLNIIEINTLEEFIERIKNLDWYYHMSDDPSVYARGEAQRKYYQNLVYRKGPKWEAAWDNQRSIVFNKNRGF
jgi:hypothetical protein